jgi:hypothetical protein
MNEPINVGTGRYVCPGCAKEMYYDGRCGDGPICMNDNCPEKRRLDMERAYWANDRR